MDRSPRGGWVGWVGPLFHVGLPILEGTIFGMVLKGSQKTHLDGTPTHPCRMLPTKWTVTWENGEPACFVAAFVFQLEAQREGPVRFFSSGPFSEPTGLRGRSLKANCEGPLQTTPLGGVKGQALSLEIMFRLAGNESLGPPVERVEEGCPICFCSLF